MSSKASKHNKFEFDTDYQESILQYTLTDRNGYRALDFYTPDYFTTTEDSIVALAITSYFKRKKKVPQDKIYLKEELRNIFTSKDYEKLLSDKDREEILRKVNRLYRNPVKDGDELFTSLVKFKSYCEVKATLEQFDLKDFNSYDAFQTNIQKAINLKNTRTHDEGTFLIADVSQRQAQRQTDGTVFSTPFWQLDRLTNSGRGWDKGSVIVVLAPEKKFKTGALVNISKSLMKRKKKILYVDLENGQDSLAMRFEQSLSKSDKKQILSGEKDKEVAKILRKYKRLGTEVDIKRFPAYSTTTFTLQAYVDKQYREHGIIYDVVIIDYPNLMGATSGQKDDFNRISDAYVDIKNFASRNSFEAVYCAAHTTREAAKRFKTVFETTDTAKCIDINRHVDVMLGMQQDDSEEAAGVLRLELIQQRDGKKGRALFWINHDCQRLDEFTKTQVSGYESEVKSTGQERPAQNSNRKLASDA